MPSVSESHKHRQPYFTPWPLFSPITHWTINLYRSNFIFAALRRSRIFIVTRKCQKKEKIDHLIASLPIWWTFQRPLSLSSSQARQAEGKRSNISTYWFSSIRGIVPVQISYRLKLHWCKRREFLALCPNEISLRNSVERCNPYFLLFCRLALPRPLERRRFDLKLSIYKLHYWWGSKSKEEEIDMCQIKKIRNE